MPIRLRADLVLLLVAFLWGTAFAALRTAAQMGSVYFFNGARFLLAALFLLPFARKSEFRPGQFLWMLAAGGVLFIASAFQQAGMVHTSAGNAGFLTSLYVVIVPFVLYLGWREKPHRYALLAVFLAVTGAYLLSAVDRIEFHPGDTLEVAGALFWALHVVLLGKYASRYAAIAFSAGQLLVGSLLNLIIGVIVEPLVICFSFPFIGSIIYTAVASLGLGYTLQIWGQKHTPPTDAAIILSLESVFAALAGGFLLGENLAIVQKIGCSLIVAAAILSQAQGWSRIAKPIFRNPRSGTDP